MEADRKDLDRQAEERLAQQVADLTEAEFAEIVAEAFQVHADDSSSSPVLDGSRLRTTADGDAFVVTLPGGVQFRVTITRDR